MRLTAVIILAYSLAMPTQAIALAAEPVPVRVMAGSLGLPVEAMRGSFLK